MRTAVCIASGPSLTAEDCSLVESSGLFTIAVNSSWKAARFCNVIYAGDRSWWENCASEIDIPAARWTSWKGLESLGCNHHDRRGSYYNSGMRAIQFAIDKGFEKIILLGYDCSVSNGVHWHGKHEKMKNPDQARVHLWKGHFAAVATEAQQKKVEVLNCSRYTELDCFKKVSLEEVLHVN